MNGLSGPEGQSGLRGLASFPWGSTRPFLWSLLISLSVQPTPLLPSMIYYSFYWLGIQDTKIKDSV